MVGFKVTHLAMFGLVIIVVSWDVMVARKTKSSTPEMTTAEIYGNLGKIRLYKPQIMCLMVQRIGSECSCFEVKQVYLLNSIITIYNLPLFKAEITTLK